MLDGYVDFCAYLQRESGIVVDDSKRYLVESRVLPIVRREKLSGLRELLRAVEGGRAPKLAQEVIQAMTINETYFFRDRVPFDAFANVILPGVLAARGAQDTIRIWCAACSSGQEPYSLAMLLAEQRGRIGARKVEIVATDVAPQMIARASSGIYSTFEVQRGLSPERLARYFVRDGQNWRLSADVQQYVTFKNFNLLSSFDPLGSFDVIFCRNVLFYFDVKQKADILRRLARASRSDGYLVLGASESVVDPAGDWVPATDAKTCLRRRFASANSADPPKAKVPTVQATPVGRQPLLAARR